MNVLDLFSGIGGFSLGLERAGMRTVAFCEIEPYCRAVLAKHWPGIPILGDIRTVGAEQIDALEPIDVICGGFPCQDISLAGKGAGLSGERSGLWTEYARLIRLIRPSYVIVENVAALLARGISAVLGDLASIRYDAQWHCVPASHVGAPHRRDRIWIIAYPQRDELWDKSGRRCGADWAHSTKSPDYGSPESMANPARDVRAKQTARRAERQRVGSGCQSGDVGDAASLGRREDELDVSSQERGWQVSRQLAGSDSGTIGHWLIEPDVGRVAHGVPARVDRLRALGNAVVPQIPEIIGRAIMSQQFSDRDRG